MKTTKEKNKKKDEYQCECCGATAYEAIECCGEKMNKISPEENF